MIYKGKNQEYLELANLNEGQKISFDKSLSYPLIFIWVKGPGAKIMYEGTEYALNDNVVLCLTVFQEAVLLESDQARLIKFNREFYCILDHDQEVSCKGLLFYGNNPIPIIQIPEEETEKFELLWKVFQTEMESAEDLQLDMLQMMLKRFIILCTRLYKSQQNLNQTVPQDTDTLREFNFLVEQHYKTKHTVKEYADLLNKSAKTLSNLFTRLSGKSPLQIIHERKMLEAKRLLRYTDKSVKEIGYELGFEDIQTFSRFFKKSEGASPTEFKQSILGNLAKSPGYLP